MVKLESITMLPSKSQLKNSTTTKPKAQTKQQSIVLQQRVTCIHMFVYYFIRGPDIIKVENGRGGSMYYSHLRVEVARALFHSCI